MRSDFSLDVIIGYYYYCTVLYCTVLYCTVLYCTLLIMFYHHRYPSYPLLMLSQIMYDSVN